MLFDFDFDRLSSDFEGVRERPRELLLSEREREPDLPFLERERLLRPRDLERDREYLERERDLKTITDINMEHFSKKVKLTSSCPCSDDGAM